MQPPAFVDIADTQYIVLTLHGDPNQVHVPAEGGGIYVSLSVYYTQI